MGSMSLVDDDGQSTELGRGHAFLGTAHEGIAKATRQALNALPAAATAAAAAPPVSHKTTRFDATRDHTCILCASVAEEQCGSFGLAQLFRVFILQCSPIELQLRQQVDRVVQVQFAEALIRLEQGRAAHMAQMGGTAACQACCKYSICYAASPADDMELGNDLMK